MMTSRKFRFVTQGAAARVLVALAVVACLAAVVPVALATDTDCDGNETDGGGYSCTLSSADQIPDISGTGTAISTWYPKGCSGDDCYALVDLSGGATFTWYGNSYSSVYVGSNGYVSFGTGYTQEVSTLSIPSTTDPDNAIFAYGDDLDPGSGGTVYYQQTTCNFDLDGDGSNDTCLVVQWDSVEYYGSTNTVTAQVALDLDIAKAVVEVVPENDPSGGEKPQLVGSENSYGTAGLWYKNGTDVDSRAATDGHQFIFSPDLDSPAVSSTTPADDATDVAVDADVVINFDEAMDTSSVTLTVVSGTDPGNW